MAEVVTIKGADEIIRRLQALPKEVIGKRGGPALRALRKGARVIHKQARQNLQAVTANATSEGRNLSTGHLQRALIVSRGKAPFDGKGERVLVRVRKRTYPGESTTTQQTAGWLEYGTENQPAEPYLRPAFISKAREAITTVERELLLDLDKLANRK